FSRMLKLASSGLGAGDFPEAMHVAVDLVELVYDVRPQVGLGIGLDLHQHRVEQGCETTVEILGSLPRQGDEIPNELTSRLDQIFTEDVGADVIEGAPFDVGRRASERQPTADSREVPRGALHPLLTEVVGGDQTGNGNLRDRYPSVAPRVSVVTSRRQELPP